MPTELRYFKTGKVSAMIRDWLHRITCRYFGHQWGDWKYYRVGDGFGWPMKSRTCKRCGKVDERDDDPEMINCRCWLPYIEE
jgi:hypothetical protein